MKQFDVRDCYFSPLQYSKSIWYICKFVITKFVLIVKVWRLCTEFSTALQNTSLYWRFRYIHVCNKQVLLHQILTLTNWIEDLFKHLIHIHNSPLHNLNDPPLFTLDLYKNCFSTKNTYFLFYDFWFLCTLDVWLQNCSWLKSHLAFNNDGTKSPPLPPFKETWMFLICTNCKCKTQNSTFLGYW